MTAFQFRPNLNGDTREELIEQYRFMRDAAKELQTAMRYAFPNGRNYQSGQHPGALKEDRDHFTTGLVRVSEILDLIEEYGKAIAAEDDTPAPTHRTCSVCLKPIGPNPINGGCHC